MLSICQHAALFFNEDDHSFVLSVIFLERLLHIKSQIFKGNHAKSPDNSYFGEVGNNTCRLSLYMCITTFRMSNGLHDIVFKNYITCYVLTNTLIFRQNMHWCITTEIYLFKYNTKKIIHAGRSSHFHSIKENHEWIVINRNEHQISSILCMYDQQPSNMDKLMLF
jgi:hypothetical protein